MERIYLDNNATTAIAPEVLSIMQEALAMGPANPSSTHFFGQRARGKLLEARQTIADFFGVKSHELIFTSGGTEAINLLLRGTANNSPKGKIISSNVEHSSVESTLVHLEQQGWRVDRLPAGTLGAVQPHQIEQALDEQTRLIILSAVNSETGVKTPTLEIARIAQGRKIPFLVDGVAWLGKEPFSLHPGISGIAFSAHKIHGPKGVGLAIARNHLKILPLLTGGPQEAGRRPGTENLEGILGFACAIDLLSKKLEEMTIEISRLRNHFEMILIEQCHAIVNGQGERISNTANLAFPGVDGETLLIHLDMAGIAASHGSACSSGSLEPSRVLLNMGISPALARSSIRFSLSRFTTLDEIDRAASIISHLASQPVPCSINHICV